MIKDLNDIIKDLDPDLNRDPEGITIDPEDYRDKWKKFKQQGKPFLITKVEEDLSIKRKKGQPAVSKKHRLLH